MSGGGWSFRGGFGARVRWWKRGARHGSDRARGRDEVPYKGQPLLASPEGPSPRGRAPALTQRQEAKRLAVVLNALRGMQGGGEERRGAMGGGGGVHRRRVWDAFPLRNSYPGARPSENRLSGSTTARALPRVISAGLRPRPTPRKAPPPPQGIELGTRLDISAVARGERHNVELRPRPTPKKATPPPPGIQLGTRDAPGHKCYRPW